MQRSLVDRMVQYNTTLGSAFRSLAKEGTGVLSRQELRDFFGDTSGFQRQGAFKTTGNVNLGGVSDKAVEVRDPPLSCTSWFLPLIRVHARAQCLLDFIDPDGDGIIHSHELNRVLEADDLVSLANGGLPQPPRPAAEEAEIRGVPLSKVKAAQRVLRERVLINTSSLWATFRKVRSSARGALGRDEILELLRKQHILFYEDFYTKQTRGYCSEAQIHALLDLADTDGDGQISFTEFANIMTIDDLEAVAMLKLDRSTSFKRSSTAKRLDRNLLAHR